MTEPVHAPEEEVMRWLKWAKFDQGRPDSFLHEVSAQIAADVVLAHSRALTSRREWFPIASLPEGRHVLLYWPSGEKGVGGIECAMVFRDGDRWSYWTHGGPNSGSDWEPADEEKPTHWMPLPRSPESADG